MSRTLLLAVMLCVCATADAGVNKCKDKNGTVVYSEQPCDKPGSTKIKELSKSDLKGNEVRVKEPPPPAPGELQPLKPPPNARPVPDRD